MNKIIAKSAMTVLSLLLMAGCSTPSASPSTSSQAFVPGTQIAPPETEDQEGELVAVQPMREVKADDDEDDPFNDKTHRDPDGDDYQALSGMVQFAGQKSRRQMEMEKIHRLAKMCIAANNVSAPCLDIIRTNARMGKFYILQETQSMDSSLRKWSNNQ